MSADAQLQQFANWQPPASLAAWHLLDDCFPGGGTIGLATVGSLCSTQQRGQQGYLNVGLSWYSETTWLTFAHEVLFPPPPPPNAQTRTCAAGLGGGLDRRWKQRCSGRNRVRAPG